MGSQKKRKKVKKHIKKYTKKNPKKSVKKSIKKKQIKKKVNKKIKKQPKIVSRKKMKPNLKLNENLFKMVSYESKYSNIDGNVNTMERKIETDNDKTNIWEKKNDKITEKTIHHSDKKQQVDIEPKIELSELKPLHSFELPYLLESNPFNDFFYSPNIFNK